jgi:hypothetical protein
VQAKARKIESRGCYRAVQHGQDPFRFLHKVEPDAAPVAALIQVFQPAVLEALNHKRAL